MNKFDLIFCCIDVNDVLQYDCIPQVEYVNRTKEQMCRDLQAISQHIYKDMGLSPDTVRTLYKLSVFPTKGGLRRTKFNWINNFENYETKTESIKSN